MKNEARKLAKGALFPLITVGLVGLFIISISLTPIIFVSYLILQRALKSPKSSKEFTIKHDELSKFTKKSRDFFKYPTDTIYIEFNNKNLFKTEDLLTPAFKSGLTFSDSIKNAIKLIIAIPKVFVFFLQKGLDVTGLKSTKTEKSQDVSDVFNMLSVVRNRIRCRGKINISQMKKDVTEKLASNIKSVIYEHLYTIEQDRKIMIKQSVCDYLRDEEHTKLKRAMEVSESIMTIIKCLDSEVRRLSSNDSSGNVMSLSSENLSKNTLEKAFCSIVMNHRLFNRDHPEIPLPKLKDEDIKELLSLSRSLSEEIPFPLCEESHKLADLLCVYKCLLEEAIAGTDDLPSFDDRDYNIREFVSCSSYFVASKILDNLDSNELSNFLVCNNDLMKQSLKSLFTVNKSDRFFGVIRKINNIAEEHIRIHSNEKQIIETYREEKKLIESRQKLDEDFYLKDRMIVELNSPAEKLDVEELSSELKVLIEAKEKVKKELELVEEKEKKQWEILCELQKKFSSEKRTLNGKKLLKLELIELLILLKNDILLLKNTIYLQEEKISKLEEPETKNQKQLESERGNLEELRQKLSLLTEQEKKLTIEKYAIENDIHQETISTNKRRKEEEEKERHKIEEIVEKKFMKTGENGSDIKPHDFLFDIMIRNFKSQRDRPNSTSVFVRNKISHEGQDNETLEKEAITKLEGLLEFVYREYDKFSKTRKSFLNSLKDLLHIESNYERHNEFFERELVSILDMISCVTSSGDLEQLEGKSEEETEKILEKLVSKKQEEFKEYRKKMSATGHFLDEPTKVFYKILSISLDIDCVYLENSEVMQAVIENLVVPAVAQGESDTLELIRLILLAMKGQDYKNCVHFFEKEIDLRQGLGIDDVGDLYSAVAAMSSLPKTIPNGNNDHDMVKKTAIKMVESLNTEGLTTFLNIPDHELKAFAKESIGIDTSAKILMERLMPVLKHLSCMVQKYRVLFLEGAKNALSEKMTELDPILEDLSDTSSSNSLYLYSKRLSLKNDLSEVKGILKKYEKRKAKNRAEAKLIPNQDSNRESCSSVDDQPSTVSHDINLAGSSGLSPQSIREGNTI